MLDCVINLLFTFFWTLQTESCHHANIFIADDKVGIITTLEILVNPIEKHKGIKFQSW